MYLIEPANAQAAQGSTGGFDPLSLLPLLLIVVVFYFFLIRPQQKKVQQQKAMLGALRRGDRVITSGGIIGIVTKIINDQEIQVEIAEDVKVRVARSMIADVVSNTEPLPESQDEKQEKKVPVSTRLKKATGRSKKSA